MLLPSWFAEIDTGGSGVVTREQFIAHRMKLVDQLDTDKDGQLDHAAGMANRHHGAAAT
jgi:hypothetical protein